MKLSKSAYETLKGEKFDLSAAEKHVNELESYAYSSKISEDWPTFIEVIQSKDLRFETEVVLLVHLSSSILENEYLKHFEGNRVYTALRLLDAISVKISKANTNSSQGHYIRISYCNIYAYLVRKLLKTSSETSEIFKQFQSRLSKDIASLVDCLQFSLDSSTLCQGNFTNMKTNFLKELRKLIKSQPQLFQQVAGRMEDTLTHAFEKPSSTLILSELLPKEIRSEAILLLAVLPLCCDDISYESKVKDLLNCYTNNFYYGFLIMCRGEESTEILRQHKFEDAFNVSPRFLFDWGCLSAVSQKSSSEASHAYLERMQILVSLITSTIRSLKVHSEHSWNLNSYLEKISDILSRDVKYLEQAKTGKQRAYQHCQGDKIVLQTEYANVSYRVKSMSMKVLNTLLESQQHGFAKYAEWLYNTLYFVVANYSSIEVVMKALLKTCVCGIKAVGPLMGEFVQYLLFLSPLKPFNLVLSHYGSYLRSFKHATNSETSAAIDEMNFRKEKKGKRHTGNQLSLQQDPKASDRIVIREHGVVTLKLSSQDHGLIEELNEIGYRKLVHWILCLIKGFMAKCAKFVLNSDDLFVLSATFSKILSYPRVFAFAPSQNKKVFFNCLSEILIFPLVNCLEAQPLLGEFDNFVTHYELAETDSLFVREAQRIKNVVFSLSQSKRLAFVDNQIDLSNYIEKRYQFVQQEFTSSLNKTLLSSNRLIRTSSSNNNKMKSSLLNQSQKVNATSFAQPNPNRFSLKRTFSMRTDESLIHRIQTEEPISDKTEKKLAVEENRQDNHSQVSTQPQSNPAVTVTATATVTASTAAPLFNSTTPLNPPASTIPATNSTPIFFGKPDTTKSTLFSTSLFNPTPQPAVVSAPFGTATSQIEEEKKVEPSSTVDDDDDDEMILNPVLDSD